MSIDLLCVAKTPRRLTLHPGRLHRGLLHGAARRRRQDGVHGDLDVSSVGGSSRRFGRVTNHRQPLLLLLVLLQLEFVRLRATPKL